jgi:thiol:disulfide interchange protein DsbC
MKRLWVYAALTAVTLASSPLLADDAEVEVIRQALVRVTGDAVPDAIEPSPATGLYEVTFGPKLFYVSRDGRYLIQGNMVDLQTLQNLTEEREKVLRKDAIEAIGEENMVIFPAKNPQHEITVFTDVDCTYCRKLHSEINDINRRGITVRYLFFPRSGPDTPSYYKSESVWCAKDRNKALTDAKAGKTLEEKRCDNPIDKHLALVSELGLRGTPAIVLEDGTVFPGYMPADKLEALVNGKIH